MRGRRARNRAGPETRSATSVQTWACWCASAEETGTGGRGGGRYRPGGPTYLDYRFAELRVDFLEDFFAVFFAVFFLAGAGLAEGLVPRVSRTLV